MISPVRKIRDGLLLTQLEFADLLKVSRMTISSYECGQSMPRVKMIKKLLALASENNIKISVSDFFVEDKELSPKSGDKRVS